MPNQATRTFRGHRDSIIKTIGRKAMYSDDINKIGHTAFGEAWAGAKSYDQVVLKPHHYYVINTDAHTGKGQHWMGLYTAANRAYLYDSYGRNPKKLVPRLVDKILRAGYSIGTTNHGHRPEQIGFTSEVCGQDSLGFLMTVRDLGIAHASWL